MGRLLDGTTGYLKQGHSVQFSPDLIPYWVAMRFKRSTTDAPSGSQFMFNHGNSPTSDIEGISILLDNTSANVVGRCSDAASNRASVTSGGTVLDTNWHSVVVAIDRVGGTIRLWLDGTESGNVAGGIGPTSDSLADVGTISAPNDLILGRANNSATSYFNGTIADLNIGRGAIPTAEQIAAFYGGMAGAKAFAGPWLACSWPLVGDSLSCAVNPAASFTFNTIGTTTPTAIDDPPLAWPLEPDIPWDSQALNNADGTDLTTTTTAEGRTWTTHSGYAAGALEVRGGRIRRPTGNANSSFAYLPDVGSRSMRVATTVRKANVSNGFAGIALKTSTSTNDHIFCYISGVSGSYVIRRFAPPSNQFNLCITPASLADDTEVPFVAEYTGNRITMSVDGLLAGLARHDYALFRHKNCQAGIRIEGAVDSGSDGFSFGPLQITRGPETRIVSFGASSGETSDDWGYHLPAIVETRDYYIIFSEARVSPGGDQNASQIVCFRANKSDLSTWTRSVVVPNNNDIRHNPVPFVLADGLTIVLLYVSLPEEFHGTSANVTAHRVVSTDQGATWGSPTDITSSVATVWSRGLILGPGRGLVCASGRLLTSASGRNLANDPRDVWAIYSDDDGNTWSASSKFIGITGGNESRAIQFADGRIIAQVRTNDALSNGLGADRFFGRAYTISMDEGSTWAELKRWPDIHSPFVVDHGESIDTGLAVTGGTILLSHPSHQVRGNMTLRASTDAGNSWNDPWIQPGRIAQGTIVEIGNAAYSDILMLDDERAAVVYNGGLKIGAPRPGNAQEFLSLAIVPLSYLGINSPGSESSRRRRRQRSARIKPQVIFYRQ